MQCSSDMTFPVVNDQPTIELSEEPPIKAMPTAHKKQAVAVSPIINSHRLCSYGSLNQFMENVLLNISP